MHVGFLCSPEVLISLGSQVFEAVSMSCADALSQNPQVIKSHLFWERVSKVCFTHTARGVPEFAVGEGIRSKGWH